MNKLILLNVLIIIGTALRGMELSDVERGPNPINEQLAGIDLSDQEGRLISIDDLFSQYITVPDKYHDKIDGWKLMLAKIKPEKYNEKIARTVRRGECSQEQVFERMVVVLQAINENMVSSQVVQEAAFEQQVKSAKTAKKHLYIALCGLGITALGLIVSVAFNFAQMDESCE